MKGIHINISIISVVAEVNNISKQTRRVEYLSFGHTLLEGHIFFSQTKFVQIRPYWISLRGTIVWGH